MEDKLLQLQDKTDYLEKIFTLSQQNIRFNLDLTWAILAVLATISTSSCATKV